MQKDEKIPGLAEVFVAHRAQLRQAAMRILGNRERADDVVQDAYVKILEAGEVFDVRQPVAYVFQVVRNLAIDGHRRGAFETGLFAAEEEGAYVAAPSDTPEARAIGRQQLALVARALGSLPQRTRRVFELYRLGGQTQREIAEEIGVSVTLVNFMVRDALVCCREALCEGGASVG